MNKIIKCLPVVFLIISLSCTSHTLAAEKEQQPSIALQAQLKEIVRQYSQDKDSDKARKGLLEIHNASASFAKPVYNLARLAEMDEYWQEALQWYEKYLELAPGTEAAGKARARIPAIKELALNDSDPDRRQTRQYDEAIKLGHAHYRDGNREEAIDQAESAAEIDPSRFEAYLMAAAIFITEKQCANAAPFLKKAAARAKQSNDKKLIKKAMQDCEAESEYLALMEKAESKSKAGKYIKAAETFKKAWKKRPARNEAGLAAAAHYSMGKEYQASREILEKLARSSSPTIAIEARRNLRNMQTVLLPKGSSDIPGKNKNSVEKMPGGDKYLQAVGLLNKGHNNKAAKLLGQAIGAIPFHPEYGYYFLRRGEVYFKQKKYNKAISDLRLASFLKPELFEIYRMLGQAYYSKKEYDLAIDTYGQGMFFASDNSGKQDFDFLRGQALYAKGELSQALHDLEGYLKKASPKSAFRKKAKTLVSKIQIAQALDNASKGKDYQAGGSAVKKKETSLEDEMFSIKPVREKSKKKKAKKKSTLELFENALDNL